MKKTSSKVTPSKGASKRQKLDRTSWLQGFTKSLGTVFAKAKDDDIDINIHIRAPRIGTKSKTNTKKTQKVTQKKSVKQKKATQKSVKLTKKSAPKKKVVTKTTKKSNNVFQKVKIRTPEEIVGGKLEFERHNGNPIIAPVADSDWESWQTFNPAAIEIDGTVYLFYRAIGGDGMSRVGLAISEDGFTIDERLPEPIFTYQGKIDDKLITSSGYKRGQFASGGGEWGGAEDPRVTVLDGRIYMFFVAYDGYSEPRLALTTIRVEDFLERMWRWSECRIVSSPGVVNKSGALLPEKIDGKFVVMHRVFPDIQLDLIDDLSQLGIGGNFLETKKLVKVRARQYWDSRKIGAGPPPLKTPYGWLLVYYATDDKDASEYRAGIMLLDEKDPSHVLYRSPLSVLNPEFWYENNGHKRGIIYPCGAVIKDGKLIVYYGGADSYVAAASVDITDLYTIFSHATKLGCNPIPPIAPQIPNSRT